jgi:hypothetical protein
MHAFCSARYLTLFTRLIRGQVSQLVHNVEWRGQGNGLTLKIFSDPSVHYDHIVYSVHALQTMFHLCVSKKYLTKPLTSNLN